MGAIGEIFAQQRRVRRAKWWLRRAARAGSPGAMNNLGILLKEGGNHVSAAHWYRQAATAGDPTADHNLRVLREDAGRAY
jgi:TPR repeat protein